MQSNRPIFAKNEFDLRFLFLLSDLIWTTMLLTISTSDATNFIENAFTSKTKEDGNAGRHSAYWVCISQAAMQDLASPACVRPQLSNYRNTTEVCRKELGAHNLPDWFGGRVQINSVSSQVCRQAQCIQSNWGQQGVNPLFNQSIPDQRVCQEWWESCKLWSLFALWNVLLIRPCTVLRIIILTKFASLINKSHLLFCVYCKSQFH